MTKPELSPFQWQDPFLLEADLQEDEALVVQMARQFASEKLLPIVSDWYLHEKTDPMIYQEFGKAGLLGTTLPTALSGVGASYKNYGLIAREMERIDSGFRSMLSVQSSLVIYPIMAYGTKQQHEKFLPDLVSGKKIGCFGLTEPSAGSDPAGIKTRATPIKQNGKKGYSLNGSKTWITNSPFADILVVWAKSDAHHGHIKGFILEKNMKGLATPKIEGKLSLRTSLTGEIHLSDVFVPEENLLLNIEGLKGPFGCLNRARFGIAFGVIGAGEDCWLRARDYALTRKQFNKPLASFQLVQLKLAEMQSEIALGFHAALRVADMFDNDKASPEVISLIKRNNSGKMLTIARMARDIHGGNGIQADYHVMRHAQNLETVNTYEGTHDIHGLILGRAQTNLQAFC
ncbi:MAG: acyl-CoA dehydrogenase family protein [Alphaproteobacteria bacterium]